VSLLLVLIGVIGQWLLGIGCAELLLRPHAVRNGRRPRWVGAEQAGLGLVLGVAATAGLSFLYSLLGGGLGREWSLSLTTAGSVWGGVVLLRGRRSPDQLSAGNVDPPGAAFVRLCGTLIVILFVLALIQTLLTPQRFWDERATFAIKAAVLDLDSTVDSPDLRNPDFVQYHPQYPLLIPLAEQHVYALLGEINDRWSKIVFPLLYLGLVLTFAGVVQRHTSSARAWLFALLLATVPVLMPWEYGFLCAQGDAPVACFHGVSLLYLWDALRNREPGGPKYRSLLIAGVTAASAAFVKDEGLAFVMVDTLALLIMLCLMTGRTDSGPVRRSFPQSATVVTTFCGVAVLCLAPWLWHRGSLPTTTEMNYFGRATPQRVLEQLDTLKWSLPHVFHRMLLECRQWGLQWWLLLAGLVAFPRRALRGEQLLLLLDVLGAVAALLLAGLLAPTAVTEHIGGSSDRFLMQLAPGAVLFAAGQWMEQPH
jgi:hypothetical protein